MWHHLYLSIVSLVFVTNKMLWPLFLCKDTNFLNLPPLSTCWWPPAPKEHVEMMLSRDKECPQLDMWSTDWLCIFHIIFIQHFHASRMYDAFYCAFDIFLCLSFEWNASVVDWMLPIFFHERYRANRYSSSGCWENMQIWLPSQLRWSRLNTWAMGQPRRSGFNARLSACTHQSDVA